MIYGSFCEIDAFPLGVFSIRNFNLHNLKGNGNAPSDSLDGNGALFAYVLYDIPVLRISYI